MNWRNVLLAAGIAAALAGLGMAFVPSLGNLIESPSEITVVLGVGALVAAALRARAWIGHDEDTFEAGDREQPTGVPPPGEDFDARLGRSSGRAAGGNTALVMVRQSLREAAVDALTTYHGHSEASANRAIDEGAWSEDRLAVEFFTTTGGAGASLSESVTSSVYGEEPFARRADHAAREIEGLTRGER